MEVRVYFKSSTPAINVVTDIPSMNALGDELVRGTIWTPKTKSGAAILIAVDDISMVLPA